MDVDDKQTDGCTANKKHLNPAKLVEGWEYSDFARRRARRGKGKSLSNDAVAGLGRYDNLQENQTD